MSRRRTLWAAFVLMMLVGILGLPENSADGPGGAAGAVGSFEVDGNSADDSGPGDPIDWQTIPTLLPFTDEFKSRTDNSFGLGSKELEPGGWTCTQGGVPGKDDIVSGALSFRTVGQDQFVYARWRRFGVNGDAHIDYEFNQSTLPNPRCVDPNVPGSATDAPRLRTNGDLLLTFDAQLGGKEIILRAFQWMGDATSGTFAQLPVGAKHVTWDGAVNISPEKSDPGLEAGAFGELALNLTKTIGEIGCGKFAFGTMKTRASTSITSEVKDRTRPVSLVLQPNPALANARGRAFAAQVQDQALLPLLGTDTVSLPVDDENHLGTAEVDSSQSGVGTDHDSEEVLAADVPGVLRADVLTASSTSTVGESPLASDQLSVAETAGVNLLNGLVTARLVRAVAFTRTTGGAATYSSAGSAINGLRIDPDGSGPQSPVAVQDVAPNTTVDISTAFGPGSFVKLFEVIPVTQKPQPPDLAGSYAADLIVNMIRVHLADRDPLTPGDQATEIIVSQAVAHSDMPAVLICPGLVSGHAFIASETSDPSLLPVTVGFVETTPAGGTSHQHLDALSLGDGGSLVSGEASESDSEGTLTESDTSASSFAQAGQVCVLRDASGAGRICATAVKSQGSSRARASGASSSDDGTVLLDVTVLGIPVTATAARNTTIELPGVGFVTLNEQFCDDPRATPPACAGTTASGLTVRAIHLVVTKGASGLLPGTEIIVSEAHSDASFGPDR